MAHKFWEERFDKTTGMYKCPACARDLKAKQSNSEKNPGRFFVSCSKDFGGCGQFGFIDEEPRFVKGPAPSKRARASEAGTNLVGPIAAAPGAHETRLADLTAEVAGLRTELRQVHELLKQMADN